ncbi:MAG: hypothetical protein WD471_01935, partial [Candidatus Paceibacterota bacterium]
MKNSFEKPNNIDKFNQKFDLPEIEPDSEDFEGETLEKIQVDNWEKDKLENLEVELSNLFTKLTNYIQEKIEKNDLFQLDLSKENQYMYGRIDPNDAERIYLKKLEQEATSEIVDDMLFVQNLVEFIIDLESRLGMNFPDKRKEIQTLMSEWVNKNPET